MEGTSCSYLHNVHCVERVHGNWSAALGRSMTALASIISAGPALFQPEFYRSLRSRYESGTFTRGFAEARQATDREPGVGVGRSDRPQGRLPVGAESIAATPQQDILLADQPDEFAAQVGCLLQNSHLANRIGAGGRYSAEKLYDWRPVYRRQALGRRLYR